MTYALLVMHAAILLILAGNLLYLHRRTKRAALETYPSVSILIPARNEAANLRRLLPSLLRQDYPDVEVLVYDDGSEDDTWAVLQAVTDDRMTALRGSGPPRGWVGKVYALYQAAQHATGDLFLFLDADAELRDAGALRRLVERFAAQRNDTVLTGLVRLRGGGRLLVSLVPNAILLGLPWPLVRRTRRRSLGAVNGQCWMIDAAIYRRFEPHAAVRNEVLEDVQIGRYLLDHGIVPVLVDVQHEVAITMYRDFAEAWQGFRKNAYLILSGRPVPFLLLAAAYGLIYVLAPLVSPWFLVTIYLFKTITDWRTGFPWWLSALAPLSYLLGTIMQVDSAMTHWTGRVSWKGRRVGDLPTS